METGWIPIFEAGDYRGKGRGNWPAERIALVAENYAAGNAAFVADLVAIVVRRVPSYPSIGGYGAAGLVAHAFADVFPCSNA